MVAMLLLVELSLYCCCTLFQALDLASEAYVVLHLVADFGEMWTRNANIPGPLRYIHCALALQYCFMIGS